jgi:hypothetical protein
MEMVQVKQRNSLELRIQQAESKIHQAMDHRYLSGIIKRPNLETLQFILTEAMLREAGLSPEQVETVTATLLLIYHGLAVHEEIDTLAAHSDERYRQLGVLAGDYYSSKYYRLLAEAEQIPLIGHFARAIQAINEAKAELEREPLDVTLGMERYLDLHERIHGALLTCVRVVYLSHEPRWEEIVKSFVRASVFQRELNQTQTEWKRTLSNLIIWEQSTGEERKWLKGLSRGKGFDQNRLLSMYVKYGTSAQIYRQLTDVLDLVRPLLPQDAETGEDLRDLMDRLLEFTPGSRRICEEG